MAQLYYRYSTMNAGKSIEVIKVAYNYKERGKNVLVQHPNYSVNHMTPEGMGCNVELLECKFEDGFKFDIERLDKMVTPKTKFVSINFPVNPSGAMITEDELKRIIDICEKNDCYLISDETYREMAHDKPLPVAATLSKKAISISSFSKVYGFPGIRVGWLHTQDAELMSKLLNIKEQINVHGSVLDEIVALKIMENRDEWLPIAREKILRRKEITKKWVLEQDCLTWNEPKGGCTCFVKADESLGIDFDDTFYDYLLTNYGAYPGAGSWFEFPKNYMRIGFVWPRTDEELINGLEGITKAINDLRKDK